MDGDGMCCFKKSLAENGKFYLASVVLLLGIKYFYATADSDQLLWILAPTAWWIGILSGIPFEYVSPIGFINHSFQFILAPSCSGVRFMIICAAMLIFSFLHRMKTHWKRFLWLTGSLALSYLFTILVNGFRVLISIWLPLFPFKSGAFRTLNQWLTAENLHTMIGTIIYFTSLLALYATTEACLKKTSDSIPRSARWWWLPAFWYFAILLGIPLLNRPYKASSPAFLHYAGLTALPCMIILGTVGLIWLFFHKLKKYK